MRESSLQSKVLRDLESLGKRCVVFKIEKSSVNGVPDIFFTTILTSAVMIEMKQEGEIPTKKQQFIIDKLNACGTQTYKIDSIEDWIKLKKILRLDQL